MSAPASGSGWDPTAYQRNASFVYCDRFTAPVLELLGAQPSWRILDVGCGTGELTVELARRSASVLGVDSSPAMIESARRALPKELSGRLSYEIADGQALSASIDEQDYGTFDAVFSSAAIHWMKQDPAAVVSGVAKMLKPSGRFAGECGGALNCSTSPRQKRSAHARSRRARGVVRCASAATRRP